MALDNERTRVAHLLRRAGFGSERAGAERVRPAWVRRRRQPPASYESQPEVPDRVAPEEVGLQVWWLDKMVHTNRPLQEKMTLFWHGHLTSALRKVKDPNLLQAQNQLFRANALGSFGDLLKAISRDGAMIRWLDLQTNRTGAPNENYARELLELFTLGVGNYTEDDVDEVARAFTGWSATPDGRVRVPPDAARLRQQDDPRADRQFRRRRRHRRCWPPTRRRRASSRASCSASSPTPTPSRRRRAAGGVYLASSGSIRRAGRGDPALAGILLGAGLSGPHQEPD